MSSAKPQNMNSRRMHVGDLWGGHTPWALTSNNFLLSYNISSLHKLCYSFVFSSGYKGLMQVNLIFRNAKLQSSRQNTGKSVVLRSFFYSLIHELSTLTFNKTFYFLQNNIFDEQKYKDGKELATTPNYHKKAFNCSGEESDISRFVFFSVWMLWGDHSLKLLNGPTQALLAEGHPSEQTTKQLYSSTLWPRR